MYQASIFLLLGLSSLSWCLPAPRRWSRSPPQCEVRLWSSDTELCQPDAEGRDCEDITFQTKKITWPGAYGSKESDCKPSMLPQCSTSDDAEVLRVCTCKVQVRQVDLMATLYEQNLVKRCDTHYVTECKPGYGIDAPKEKCDNVPVQVRERSSVVAVDSQSSS